MGVQGWCLQGYLTHKKLPPPGTLQKAYAPMVVLGGVGQLLISEIPLCGPHRLRIRPTLVHNQGLEKRHLPNLQV